MPGYAHIVSLLNCIHTIIYKNKFNEKTKVTTSLHPERFSEKNKPEFEAKNFYIYLFNSGASEEVREQWVGVSSLPGIELVSSGFATSTLAG